MEENQQIGSGSSRRWYQGNHRAWICIATAGLGTLRFTAGPFQGPAGDSEEQLNPRRPPSGGLSAARSVALVSCFFLSIHRAVSPDLPGEVGLARLPRTSTRSCVGICWGSAEVIWGGGGHKALQQRFAQTSEVSPYNRGPSRCKTGGL